MTNKKSKENNNLLSAFCKEQKQEGETDTWPERNVFSFCHQHGKQSENAGKKKTGHSSVKAKIQPNREKELDVTTAHHFRMPDFRKDKSQEKQVKRKYQSTESPS